MFLQKRILAADVLPDHDHAELSQRAEDAGWLGGALGALALAKRHGGDFGEELEHRLLHCAADLHAWLGRLIGAEAEMPLVEAIDLLCRQGGPVGESSKDHK